MLTERERKLIDCVEWLANTVHEAHHKATVPLERRRPVTECGSAICRYALNVVAGAKREDEEHGDA